MSNSAGSPSNLWRLRPVIYGATQKLHCKRNINTASDNKYYPQTVEENWLSSPNHEPHSVCFALKSPSTINRRPSVLTNCSYLSFFMLCFGGYIPSISIAAHTNRQLLYSLLVFRLFYMCFPDDALCCF